MDSSDKTQSTCLCWWGLLQNVRLHQHKTKASDPFHTVQHSVRDRTAKGATQHMQKTHCANQSHWSEEETNPEALDSNNNVFASESKRVWSWEITIINADHPAVTPESSGFIFIIVNNCTYGIILQFDCLYKPVPSPHTHSPGASPSKQSHSFSQLMTGIARSSGSLMIYLHSHILPSLWKQQPCSRELSIYRGTTESPFTISCSAYRSMKPETDCSHTDQPHRTGIKGPQMRTTLFKVSKLIQKPETWLWQCSSVASATKKGWATVWGPPVSPADANLYPKGTGCFHRTHTSKLWYCIVCWKKPAPNFSQNIRTPAPPTPDLNHPSPRAAPEQAVPGLSVTSSGEHMQERTPYRFRAGKANPFPLQREAKRFIHPAVHTVHTSWGSGALTQQCLAPKSGVSSQSLLQAARSILPPSPS